MKKLLRLSFLLILIFAAACDNAYNCSSGPASLVFEFVDKDSGENLFENGTFDPKNAITVTDLVQNKVIETVYMNSNNQNRLVLVYGFDSGTFKYDINIEGKSICQIYVSTEKRKGEHCTSTAIKSLEIKNAEFKKDVNTGVNKILIDTKN